MNLPAGWCDVEGEYGLYIKQFDAQLVMIRMKFKKRDGHDFSVFHQNPADGFFRRQLRDCGNQIDGDV